MKNKSGIINWWAVVIISVWLIFITSVLFGHKAEAQSKPAALTTKETHAIEMMTREIHQTKMRAEACLMELLIIKVHDARCALYEKTATKLRKWSALVNKIKKRQRYWFIVHNNIWYAAFNEQDALDSIVKQIDSYEKK